MKRCGTIYFRLVVFFSSFREKRPPLPDPLPQRRRGGRIGLQAFQCLIALMPVMLSIAASAQEIYLRVDQAGYLPSDNKVAVAFSKGELPPSFEILDADTQQVVYHGSTKALPGLRWGQFDHHAELDFSSVTRPGHYFLSIGGIKSRSIT